MRRRGGARLSQHFLVNQGIAERMADALAAPVGADVLEIGPGRGALTAPLLARGWRVTAVELDEKLARDLVARWGARDDFRLIQGDILKIDLGLLAGGDGAWHVVGNLPYAITSPILFHFLEQAAQVSLAGMLFMVQREVAERLAAVPGSKARGALTVGVQLQADVERLFDVSPGSFQPPPQVRSSVVRLTPHDRWTLDRARRERVRRLVRLAFGHRRKQLQKILRSLPGSRLDGAVVERVAHSAGIDLSRRPETLSLEEWLRLEEAVADVFPQ